MAVNEQIVTGRKFRKLIDEANKLWQRISFWTKASDVEFNDGKNAETKFGAINGVTDSLTSTASNIAASAKAVKTLNDKVTQLSSNISQRVEIPITIRSDWYFTASSEENYAGNQTTFTLVIEDKKARVIGNTSVTATAPASRYSKATATATIGEIVTK